MTAQLQVGNKTIQADEVLHLLHRYQLMPQVLRGFVIDQAVSEWERSANANVACTEVDRQAAIEAFCQQQQFTSSEARQAWLEDQGMTPEQSVFIKLNPPKSPPAGTKTTGMFVTVNTANSPLEPTGPRIMSGVL